MPAEVVADDEAQVRQPSGFPWSVEHRMRHELRREDLSPIAHTASVHAYMSLTPPMLSSFDVPRAPAYAEPYIHSSMTR